MELNPVRCNQSPLPIFCFVWRVVLGARTMKGLKRAIDDEDDVPGAAGASSPKKPSLAVPVDDPQLAAQWHVVEHPTGVLDALLNQTQISHNNNKFFVLQVVQKDNDSKKLKLLTRWGRVGARGQTKQEDHTNVEAALNSFRKKFKDKTGNQWGAEFVAQSGKYTLLHKEYQVPEPTPGSPVAKSALPVPPSTLPAPVQQLIKVPDSARVASHSLGSLFS
jgi:poly [ADP-ribose] polymerase